MEENEMGLTTSGEEAEATAEVRVEAEIEESLTRTKVLSRLKAIVLELEGGSLVIDGVPVGDLTDPVEFELEYAQKGAKRKLEIELKW